MIGRHSCLVAMLALFPAISPFAAETDLPQGEWMGWAITAYAMGMTIPVIEELQVVGDRVEQTGWRLPWDFHDRDCLAPDSPPDRPGCVHPVPMGAGRVVPAQPGLHVVADGPQSNPHTHPTDIEYWPHIALAGHDWTLRGDNRRFMLSRPVVLEGVSFTLERVYFGVPAGATGWVYMHLVNADLSLGQAFCGIHALHADLPAWKEFLDHSALVAPVAAELHRLSNLAPRGRQTTQRRAGLLGIPGLPDDPATDVSDLPAAALEAFRDHAERLRSGPPQTGRVALQTLAWRAPAAVADAEAACIANQFGR